jgi:hypothetical protein
MRISLLICLALATAGCGAESPSGAQSPLSPSPAALVQPANFAGEWQVTYHVEACIGRYCYISYINRDEQLTLRLLQIGDRVTGAFLRGLLATQVEGRVDADGRLSLTGGAPSTIPDFAALELLRFEATLDPAHGLRGALQYQALIPGEHSGYSSGATGPIVRAARAPFAVTSFAGTWKGGYNTTACSGTMGCLLDRKGDLELVLDDQGGHVTGTLSTNPGLRIRLSGTASGDTIVLTGSDGRVTVTALTIRRTPAGLLTGTVALSSGWTSELNLLGVALASGPP